MNILVTDGENRSSLAVVRSLGRGGHSVYVGAATKKSLASCSRYCSGSFVLPDPLCNGASYVHEICELADREKIDVLFPMTEPAIYLLNPERGRLPKNTVLACPPQDMMQAVSDKAGLFTLAKKLQVPIPKTFHLASAEDLSLVAGQIESYPVVVKPALSRIPVEGGFLAGGVRYAADKKELDHLYTNNPVLKYPSLIQEKIVGPGTGLFTLYDTNRHLALFSHQRLREKPPSGGVSVVSQSVPLDEEMVESADRLLRAIGFTGVAMVEFKRDLRDGKAKLMEINGRFWGTLQLAIACGIDFPKHYLAYMLGQRIAPLERVYRVGHTMKWFFGTLDHLLIRLKDSAAAQGLPNRVPGKLAAVYDFLRIWQRNTSFDVCDSKDMAPFFHEATTYVRALRGNK